MVIDNVKFDKNNKPLCPKCGEIIEKLAVMITIPTRNGRLYGVSCGKCGGKMLARDENETENDIEK